MALDARNFKMEFFEALKEYFGWTGISRLNPSRVPNMFQSKQSFIARIYQISAKCIIYGVLLILFVTSFSFFLFKAKTFHEYADIFFCTAVATLTTIWYSVLQWKFEQYAALFTKINNIIHKSKLISKLFQ